MRDARRRRVESHLETCELCAGAFRLASNADFGDAAAALARLVPQRAAPDRVRRGLMRRVRFWP